MQWKLGAIEKIPFPFFNLKKLSKILITNMISDIISRSSKSSSSLSPLIMAVFRVTIILILINFLLILPLKTKCAENKTQKLAEKRRLKILVYSPTLGWSHMQFMGTIADTLVEAGHDVVGPAIYLKKF